MIRDALVSANGKYRYWLTRRWRNSSFTPIVWIMLNPSTADAFSDDNTIRRCIAFSQAWGYDALTVINLYAYRSTDPRFLKTMSGEEAQGPEFLAYTQHVLRGANRIVAAWGNPGGNHSPWWLQGHLVDCLGVTKTGAPRHPLYVPSNTPLQPLIGRV